MAFVRIQDFFKDSREGQQNFVFIFKAELKTNLGNFASVPTVIPVDATFKENYNLSAAITENEVQSGSVLTDHIHKRPQTISVTCAIVESPVFFLPSAVQSLIDLGTNTAFSSVSGATSGVFSSLSNRFAPVLGYFDKYAREFVSGKISANVLGDGRLPRKDVQKTFWTSFLKARQNEAQPFKVVSKVDVLDNVFFEDISFDREAQTGDSLIFDCVLKEIRVIKSNIVITNRAGYAHKPVDRGGIPLLEIGGGLTESGGGAGGGAGAPGGGAAPLGGGFISPEALRPRQVYPGLPAGAISGLENKIVTTATKAKKKLTDFLGGLFD